MRAVLAAVQALVEVGLPARANGEADDALQCLGRAGAKVAVPARLQRISKVAAASIASMILTTEALIADKPEEKGAAGMGMPPGGMGGMDY